MSTLDEPGTDLNLCDGGVRMAQSKIKHLSNI